MMEANEYIETGILELYVFGKTTEAENEEVQRMAARYSQVREEILSIEQAVISLSYSMAPYLSSGNFDSIRAQLLLKHNVKTDTKSRSNWSAYLAWAAVIVLLLYAGYQYTQLDARQNEVTTIETEKLNLKKQLDTLGLRNRKTQELLAVVRDENNTIVPLTGQTIAPDAKAKVYWNQQTQTVYVDASGLPEPPEGMEYQVWSLKLVPALTPTSIGMLTGFRENESRIFEVQSTDGAEAFGITLEPAGGSPTPTLEQLYALGKV